LFFGLSGGFSLCALRTAGPASLARPEAVDPLLFQLAFAVFTATNGVFCFSFDAKEKRFPPLVKFQLDLAAFTAANVVSLLLF